jgi:hypothetical protein
MNLQRIVTMTQQAQQQIAVNNSLESVKRSGVEETACKLAMLLRGWNHSELAKRAGLNPRVLSNVLSGNTRTWPPRRAINRAFQQKIFSKPKNTAPTRKPKKAQSNESS